MLAICGAVFIALILLSILRPATNPGYPALLLAFLIAPLTSTAAAANPFLLFPSKLFFTLLGVTLFFAGLNRHGLISQTVFLLFRRTETMPRIVPPLVFLLVAALTACGIGNIASVALIAPLAIPLATKLNISPLVMTILIVGGANASSFSPITLPGILTHTYIDEGNVLSTYEHSGVIQWWIFWVVFVCITTTTFLSYQALKKRPTEQRDEIAQDITVPVAAQLQFSGSFKAHKATIAVVSGVAFFFVVANVASVSFIANSLSSDISTVLSHLKNVGTLGWIGTALLIFSGQTRLGDDLKSVPWGTLILVCGMSAYIELLTQLGLAETIANLTANHTPISLLPSAFAMSSGFVSAFSSSVGVALPLFLPIIKAISESLTQNLTAVLIYSLSIGSHLVDASPLSTLGALCLSQIVCASERQRCYKSLMIYSFAMIPVAGIWGLVLLKLFG